MFDLFHHHMACVWTDPRAGGPPLLTFRVLCRARSVCIFSLMTGFLLRRMNDFLKWSCVNGCSWPIRETPPSFMLFSIVLISSSGPPRDDGDGGTDRKSSGV